MTKPIPEEIKDYISYDPETGVCVWKKKNGHNQVNVGDTAGYLEPSSGYIKLKFAGQLYRLHRVIWYLHYGEQPGDKHIDHMNRDRSDNRISNLRLVTCQQNNQNATKLGIYFDKSRQQWRSEIVVSGKKHYIGQHTCPLMVGLDYLAAKSVLHPTAVRGLT